MADDVFDGPERLEALLDQQEPRIARGFRTMVAQVKDAATIALIMEHLEFGRLDIALDEVLRAGRNLGTSYLEAFSAAGEDTARFLGQNVEHIVMDFDRMNPWAVNVQRENQLRLVREFTAGQRRATQEALLDGIQRGINPRAQARAFRDSIGLTQSQVRAVNNYERYLKEGDRTALHRALRDKRFDRTVERALKDGTPLRKEQVDRMVGRYRERMLKYRSEVIARSESLRAVHQGNDAMYRQAIEAGDLQQSNLEQEWFAAADERVRDSHSVMHGQIQMFGTPFISGAGNALMYPGDPAAPAADIILCRCTLGTTMKNIQAPSGLQIDVLS